MIYDHTQRGPIVVWLVFTAALVGVILLPGLIAATVSTTPALATAAAVVVLQGVAYTLFHSLRVVVDEAAVHAIFGVGLIRFSYRLENIERAHPVRNKWYYGWGIRLIRGGVLLNVSGLDAVELVLRGGSVRRIGTDEPEVLVRAIETARSARAL